ncbi:putative DNA-directed RNA polymerase [Bienertia sinuspersici]
MPIVYGKTLMSAAEDIQYFWKDHVMEMEYLVRLIGWFSSILETPVLYVTPFFSTSKNFMVMEAHSIGVYDEIKKRKRKVTLRVPSKVKRDRRKNEISTFVNFIHQKHAYIAMRVV